MIASADEFARVYSCSCRTTITDETPVFYIHNAVAMSSMEGDVGSLPINDFIDTHAVHVPL